MHTEKFECKPSNPLVKSTTLKQMKRLSGRDSGNILGPQKTLIYIASLHNNNNICHFLQKGGYFLAAEYFQDTLFMGV